MFTPQEIQERADNLEKAVFGGYSVSSVEELIGSLSKDYAELYKENAVLKSRIKSLAEKIEEYRQQEESISSALLTAQQTADSIINDAQRKSARMLSESEQKLRARNQELMLEVNAEQERVTLAKQAAAKFVVELEDRVQAQLETLEKIKQMDLSVKKEAAPAPAPASAAENAKPAPRTSGAAVNPLLRRTAAQTEPEETPKSTAKEIEESINRILAQSSNQGASDSAGNTRPVKPLD